MKTIKKKQKHKSKGSVRTVSKTVQNDSFFNFFSPPTGNYSSTRNKYVINSLILKLVSDDADADIDEDTRALLTADFEIGHYIRESIIPRATLYFTGMC